MADMTFVYGDYRLAVESFEEASAAFLELRKERMLTLGGMNQIPMVLDQDEAELAVLSFNGKVWATDGSSALFDPGLEEVVIVDSDGWDPEEPLCGREYCLGVVVASIGLDGVQRCAECARFDTDEAAMAWLYANFHTLRVVEDAEEREEELDFGSRLGRVQAAWWLEEHDIHGTLTSLAERSAFEDALAGNDMGAESVAQLEALVARLQEDG